MISRSFETIESDSVLREIISYDRGAFHDKLYMERVRIFVYTNFLTPSGVGPNKTCAYAILPKGHDVVSGPESIFARPHLSSIWQLVSICRSGSVAIAYSRWRNGRSLRRADQSFGSQGGR